MKMPTFVYPRGTQQLLTLTFALALCACATTSLPQKPDGESASLPLTVAQTFSGEDMINSGRTHNADALRSLSPIFH